MSLFYNFVSAYYESPSCLNIQGSGAGETDAVKYACLVAYSGTPQDGGYMANPPRLRLDCERLRRCFPNASLITRVILVCLSATPSRMLCWRNNVPIDVCFFCPPNALQILLSCFLNFLSVVQSS